MAKELNSVQWSLSGGQIGEWNTIRWKKWKFLMVSCLGKADGRLIPGPSGNLLKLFDWL